MRGEKWKSQKPPLSDFIFWIFLDNRNEKRKEPIPFFRFYWRMEILIQEGEIREVFSYRRSCNLQQGDCFFCFFFLERTMKKSLFFSGFFALQRKKQKAIKGKKGIETPFISHPRIVVDKQMIHLFSYRRWTIFRFDVTWSRRRIFLFSFFKEKRKNLFRFFLHERIFFSWLKKKRKIAKNLKMAKRKKKGFFLFQGILFFFAENLNSFSFFIISLSLLGEERKWEKEWKKRDFKSFFFKPKKISF